MGRGWQTCGETSSLPREGSVLLKRRGKGMFSLISLPVVIVQLRLRCGGGPNKILSIPRIPLAGLAWSQREAAIIVLSVFASRIQKELAVGVQTILHRLAIHIIHGN